MKKTLVELIEIIESEGGTVVSIADRKAEVRFPAGHTSKIPLTMGASLSHRWLKNFRRDVRHRRDTLQSTKEL